MSLKKENTSVLSLFSLQNVWQEHESPLGMCHYCNGLMSEKKGKRNVKKKREKRKKKQQRTSLEKVVPAERWVDGCGRRGAKVEVDACAGAVVAEDEKG